MSTTYNYIPNIPNIIEKESWVKIEGFEYYWVSSFGRVWSTKSNKFLKPNLITSGYYQVSLQYRDKGVSRNKNLLVHRLVAIAFLGKRRKALDVNHKDMDKTNNNLDNLEWLTRKQNVRHAIKNGGASSYTSDYHSSDKAKKQRLEALKKGRSKLREMRMTGSVGGGALIESQVLEIIAELKTPYRGQLSDLAEKYNVSQPTISKIKSGETWKHLPRN